MNIVETYRVVAGTTRALLHFERTDEVCECVAEMVVERRLSAGLRSSPGAVRRIASMLRSGVKFVEDERGLIVPSREDRAPFRQGAGRPSQADNRDKPQPTGKSKPPPGAREGRRRKGAKHLHRGRR